MTRNLLYINNTLVDLYPDTVIAQTFQSFEVGKLGSVRVSYTNQIKIPKSAANRKIFGFSDDIKSSTSFPYTKQTARYVSDGIEIIRDGICNITSITDTEISLAIFSAERGLFDAIQNKKLYQLEYLTNSGWRNADIDAARLNTSGLFSPVMNWGTNVVNETAYLPCFFYGEIVKKILEQTGLTLSGDILTDTDFTDLVIPFSLEKWEYPSIFTNRYKFYARSVSDTVTAPLTTNTKIAINGSLSEGDANPFDPNISSCSILDPSPTAGSNDFISMNFTISFHADATGTTGDKYDYNLIRDRGGAETILATTTRTMPAPGLVEDLELTASNVDLRAGDKVFLRIQPNTGSPSVTTSNVFFQNTVNPKVYIGYVFWNYLLPDILMTDVIKDFVLRFGIIFKQSGNTLTIKTLEDVLANKTAAADWTTKHIPQEREVTFEFSGYAQNNYFKYKDNIDNDTIGRGNISIANTNLSLETSLSSIFGNCLTQLFNNINKAYIPVYDATSASLDDVKEGSVLTVLTLRNRDSATDPPVSMGGTFRTDYRVAYFEDARQTKSSNFQYFIDKYYKTLKVALQKTKTVKRYYNLTVVDIARLELPQFIYDSDSYFLINKIHNFIQGRPTKVELLKI